MKNPKIKTKVVHSKSHPAWNVVGTSLGKKRKIARIPYDTTYNDDKLNERSKNEAFDHAEFISWCFNNSDQLVK